MLLNSKPQLNVDAFNQDVVANAGYWYTTNAPLSSRLANLRNSEGIFGVFDFTGRRVIDIGCGDGCYTVELSDRGRPAIVCGIDPAPEAIKVARQKAGQRTIRFAVESAYALPYKENSFDVALFRGVLHHLDRPRLAISEAFRVAKTIIALEPNGYNPGLKLLEKCSKYHIRHGEKSYLPFQLDKWLNEFGGTIIGRRWVGLVPCFCPDWLAKLLKVTEPAVERTPGINLLACAVYIVAAARDEF